MSHFRIFFFHIPPSYLKIIALSLAAKLPAERWTECTGVGEVEVWRVPFEFWMSEKYPINNSQSLVMLPDHK